MSGSPVNITVKRFYNKVVVVTGASRGIGQAVCVALAKEGAVVVGVARSDLTETSCAVKAAGGQFIVNNADLGTGTQRESAEVISQILRNTGRIDALINNAGIIRRAPAKDFSEADWNAVMATNLNSPFFLMQAVGNGGLKSDVPRHRPQRG
jgi:2-deoxy-D-gluconate 3-dehydrogenase